MIGLDRGLCHRILIIDSLLIYETIMVTSALDFKTATINDLEALNIIAEEMRLRGDKQPGTTATKIVLEFKHLKHRSAPDRLSAPAQAATAESG